MKAPSQVTRLLIEWGDGDPEAFDKLMPLVRSELRRLAAGYMRREHAGHTLQTTALINEAYLRLVDQRRVRWQNRAHFFGIAARLMRRVLVDHARRAGRLKRGGDAARVELEHAAMTPLRSAELVRLDDALKSLAAIDERKASVVELRYFGGLSVEETAEVLGVSANTVLRDWSTAKLWLRREVEAG